MDRNGELRVSCCPSEDRATDHLQLREVSVRPQAFCVVAHGGRRVLELFLVWTRTIKDLDKNFLNLATFVVALI